MREVGVVSAFAKRDGNTDTVDHSQVLAGCEKRLLDIEHDLRNSECTFEAVRWGLSELQRLELRDRNSGPRDGGNDDTADGATLDAGDADAERGSIESGNEQDRLSNVLQPEAFDSEKNNTTVSSRNVKPGEHESMEVEQLVKKPTSKVDEPTKVERGRRDSFKAQGGGKRKPEEMLSGNEGEKRAKVRQSSDISVLKQLVIEAGHGGAGRNMAERINNRLAVSECVYLTNLISHSLVVSMDQIPTMSVQKAIASLYLTNYTDPDFSKEMLSASADLKLDEGLTKPVSGDGDNAKTWESTWLLRWLVRTVLSDATYNWPSPSLDWLIAFMSGTRESIAKPILDDLASDLLKREIEGSAPLVSYLRRAAILESAALRDPELTLAGLRPLLPPAAFPSSAESKGDGGDQVWQGWLGLMILCPRLFGVFARHCVPTLSFDIVKTWRINPSTDSLPAVWTLIQSSSVEGPKTTTEWFYAAVIRRLPELAPVAFDLVVLLGELDDGAVNLQSSDNFLAHFGNNLLTMLYERLSKYVLPSVLGRGQDSITEAFPDDIETVEKDKDAASFMENLKQHCNELWRKALERCSTSTCTCCATPRKDDESYVESSCRTETAIDEGSMCVETSEEGLDMRSKQLERGNSVGSAQRGCFYRDPFIRICHLTLLCCTEHVVADLLVNASLLCPTSSGSFEASSLRRLMTVMRMMRILSSQARGRGTLILEIWAQQMTNRATAAGDEQALQIVLAMRQLLDPIFWQNHDSLLRSWAQFPAVSSIVDFDDAAGQQQGLSWKLVWKGLHKVLDLRWLHILPLMHRDGAWELRLAVLGVLQLLSSDGTTRPQVVADRLKGILGLFFSWLELYDGCEDNAVTGNSGMTATPVKPRLRWRYARAMEHLKSIIVELAASSFPSFTLMVNSLLDFSFEHSTQFSSSAVLLSSSGPLSRTELPGIRAQGFGMGGRSSFSSVSLSTGKLDRYGKLVLTTAPTHEVRSSTGSVRTADNRLREENRRIQSGASSSQTYEKERILSGRTYSVSQSASAESRSTSDNSKQDLLLRSKIINADLGSLLHRALERAISKSVELLDAWPCHPANVLATHMADRLETPHEVPMTMEQYEEVLPKHISSPRHIFLTDCFSQNPLLMEMVELIVRHGRRNRAVLRCVEFVRVLLADSISSWHGAFRTRWPHPLLQAKVNEEEARSRMQASRLIQLVASVHWLPQPLAASAEIVGVIDGADISDLLLLVWRCMHHAITFGSKAWGESSSNLHLLDSQGISSTCSGGDEEAGKEGTYTEWESHFFAILRRNISKIGAHFAQVYPIRKAF